MIYLPVKYKINIKSADLYFIFTLINVSKTMAGKIQIEQAESGHIKNFKRFIYMYICDKYKL